MVLCSVLQISFRESEYFIEEGSDKVQLKKADDIIITCSVQMFRVKMVVFLQLLILLLSRQGLCQLCYRQLSCEQYTATVENQRDCCLMRNGLSYDDGGTCRQCIGMKILLVDII